MGQPNPPGDNVPLYEGLSSDWNDIVSAFPEDRRNELAPMLKGRIDSIEQGYAPLKQWEDFSKSGITPDHASTALNIYSMIENNPKQIYDELGKFLNITPQQAAQVVEAVQEGDDDDPRIATMQQQLDTIAQVMLAQRNQEVQTREQQEADVALDRELKALKKKYGDYDEEEIVMRMAHKNLTAEQAYTEYTNKAAELRKRPLAPMVLGGGGSVPRPNIDVKKLDTAGTKNLVAQMLTHANNERNA